MAKCFWAFKWRCRVLRVTAAEYEIRPSYRYYAIDRLFDIIYIVAYFERSEQEVV